MVEPREPYRRTPRVFDRSREPYRRTPRVFDRSREPYRRTPRLRRGGRRYVLRWLAVVVVMGCGRREPATPSALPGERAVAGPGQVVLRYRPPAGTRVVCPASVETQVTAWGEKPMRQTIGGERTDEEIVDAVEAGKRTVRRRYGQTDWIKAYPIPVPGTSPLPPSEERVTIDEAGRAAERQVDGTASAAMMAWYRQFDSVPGWPETPLRRGASIPRPLRGPGPPGTGSTLEAAAPLRLVGFVDLGGRVCAKFRSDLSGSLLFTPPGAESGSEPARSTIRGTGWLYFDVDTGVLLGSIHGFRYALPLPGTAAPGPAPDFRVLLREGPCRLE